MSNDLVATGLSYAGMALSGCMSVPQLIRASGGMSVAGVSCAAWLMAAFSAALWCCYGVTAPLGAQIPGNLVALVAATLVVVTLIRRGSSLAVVTLAVLGFLTTTGASYAIGGPLAIGWIAAGMSTVRSVPQLWTSIRAPGIAGISPASWMLNAAAAGTWLGYAVMSEDFPVMGSSLACLMIAVLILVALGRRRAM